jgi:hypothetical protein
MTIGITYRSIADMAQGLLYFETVVRTFEYDRLQ